MFEWMYRQIILMVSSLACLVLNGHWLNVQMTHSGNGNSNRVSVSCDRDNANGEGMMGIHHGPSRVNVSGERMMGTHHSSNKNGWYMTRRYGPSGSGNGSQHIDDMDKATWTFSWCSHYSCHTRKGLVKRELNNPKVLWMGHSSLRLSKASTE